MKQTPKTGYIVDCTRNIDTYRAADFKERLLVTKAQLMELLEGSKFDVWAAHFVILADFKKAHKSRYCFVDMTTDAPEDAFISYYEPEKMNAEAGEPTAGLKLQGGEAVDRYHYFFDTKTEKLIALGYEPGADEVAKTWQPLTAKEYYRILDERAAEYGGIMENIC
jgi:hypothetical protein